MPECHFKVAELKMHLRSPGAGRCESQGGVWGCAGDEDGGGGGKACVFSVARVAADPQRFIEMGFCIVTCFEKAWEDSIQRSPAADSALLLAQRSPVHPNTSRGRFSGGICSTCKRFNQKQIPFFFFPQEKPLKSCFLSSTYGFPYTVLA